MKEDCKAVEQDTVLTCSAQDLVLRKLSTNLGNFLVGKRCTREPSVGVGKDWIGQYM